MSYADTVLADSPVGYWRLGEPSGSTADNAEGTAARDGTYVGGPVLGSSGLVDDTDTALGFDSYGQYVSVPNDAAFNFTTNFSLECWVVFHNVAQASNHLFAKGDDGWELFRRTSDNLLRFGREGVANECYADATYVPLDTKLHIVATYGSGANTGKIYVNGVDRTNAGAGATFTANTSALFLGSDWTVNGTLGAGATLDEVAVYNTVLSSTRVAAHYAAGSKSVSLSLLTSASAIYAPTLTPAQFLTPGLLDGARAIYAPTLTPAQFLTPGLLDGARAIYALTVQRMAGVQGITLAFLDAGPAVYALTVQVEIDAAAFDAAAFDAAAFASGPPTASMTAPLAEFAGTGVVKLNAYGTVELIAPLAEFFGLAAASVSGTGVISAPTATLAGTGSSDWAEGTGEIIAPVAGLDGAGTAAEKFVGTGSITAPLAEFSGTGTAPDDVVATGTITAPLAGLDGVGRQTLSVYGTVAFRAAPASFTGTGEGGSWQPPPSPSLGAIDYCLELFTSDAAFGPNVKIAEVWDARDIGWSRYDRLPGRGFFTLYQTSPVLASIIPITTHIRITRVASAGTTEVFNGIVSDYSSTGDDVLFDLFDYVSLLSLSRSGYRTMYPTKLLGTEIVSPEWLLAKNATYSPLGFVTTGTIEDPLGTDNATPIKTNALFGLMDQMRLQLFWDLAEMGRANTTNQVTFEVTRTAPFTFNFWKNKGTLRDIGLVLNGTVSDYEHAPNWAAYRNDLATLGLATTGVPSEIVKTDEGAAAAKSRRQDVFTLKTLLGVSGAATEADQQQAAAARHLKTVTQGVPALWVTLVSGVLAPFDGWDVNDRFPIEIYNGRDALTGARRVSGVRGVYTETGENLSLLMTEILT